MKQNIFKELYNALINYDEVLVKNLAIESIKEGIDPIETISVLTKGISEVGDKFQKGELWLPDLMLAAKTMGSGMGPLQNEIEAKGIKRTAIGKVLIGTVFGDLHSIGKGMVSTLLSANGFEVIDLGVNVDSKKFIDAIQKYNPDILAMSALLTTTAPEMERVIKALNETGTRDKIKIMVGGGPITQEFAERIGADGYEPTAVLAVSLAKKFLNIN